MNSLLSLLPADGWTRLLCDALWQSTLIAAIGLLVARFFIRQSAARAWLLLLTLSACVLTPLCSLAARMQGWTVLAESRNAAETMSSQPKPPVQPGANGQLGESTIHSEPTEKPPVLLGVLETEHADKHNVAESASDVAAQFPDPATVSTAGLITASDASGDLRSSGSAGSGDPRTSGDLRTANFVVLGVLWLSASALLIGRVVLSLFATQRFLRVAKPCDDAALLSAVRTAAQRVGLTKPPVLLVSGEVQTPTVFCLGRPRLLVPNAAASLRDANEVELKRSAQGDENSEPTAQSRLGETRLHCVDWTAAFTHELAHVVRGDGWSRLWVEMITISLPIQPLIWLARRAFHTASEEDCDDWAVAAGTNPVDLADTLTAWINVRRNPAPLAAIGMSSTKSRTLRLLALRDKPTVRLSSAWHWVGVPIELLLIAGLAVAQTKAREEIKSRPVPAQAAAKAAADAGSNDQRKASEGIVEKAIAEDPLIMLYNRRIQEEKLYSDETDAIKSYQEKIDKRKAELRARPTQESQATPERMQTNSASPQTTAQYIIEPPDILEIMPIRLASKEPVRIQPGDKLQIDVGGAKYDEPIHGIYRVDSSGEVVLGPSYGSVKLSSLTRSEAQEAVTTQLEAILVNPQVALTIDESRVEAGITGKHLVGPDGTINLGIYGQPKVDGLTVAEARKAIEAILRAFFENPIVAVEVSASNSKVYYVFTKGRGGGDNIQRCTITGNDNVLDAISQLGQYGDLSSAKIWISRPGWGNHKEERIDVDWNNVLAGVGKNPQVLRGTGFSSRRLVCWEGNQNDQTPTFHRRLRKTRPMEHPFHRKLQNLHHTSCRIMLRRSKVHRGMIPVAIHPTATILAWNMASRWW